MTIGNNEVYINGKLRDIRDITDPAELQKANMIMAMRRKVVQSTDYDEDNEIF